jgi:hypothetical protein
MLPHPCAEHAVHLGDRRSSCEVGAAAVGSLRYELYVDEPAFAGQPISACRTRIESQLVPSERPCLDDGKSGLGGIARDWLSASFPRRPPNGVECDDPSRGIREGPRASRLLQAPSPSIDLYLLHDIRNDGRLNVGQTGYFTTQGDASTASPQSHSIDAHPLRVTNWLRVPQPSNRDDRHCDHDKQERAPTA